MYKDEVPLRYQRRTKQIETKDTHSKIIHMTSNVILSLLSNRTGHRRESNNHARSMEIVISGTVSLGLC